MTEKEYDKDPANNEQNTTSKPDPETLNTTDPQEHMEGPVSSTIQKAGAAFDSDESKSEADNKREKNF